MCMYVYVCNVYLKPLDDLSKQEGLDRSIRYMYACLHVCICMYVYVYLKPLYDLGKQEGLDCSIRYMYACLHVCICMYMCT
jgi:hypothetical protein